MTISNYWVQQNLDSNGFKILGKSNSKHSNSSGFNSVVVEMQCSNKRRLFSFFVFVPLMCVVFFCHTQNTKKKREAIVMVVMHAFIEMNYSDQFDHNLAKKPSTFFFNLWNVWKANTNWLKAMKWFEKEYPLSCCHWKMRVKIRYAQ